METLPSHIGYRILEILKNKEIRPTPWEKANGVSPGYIKRSAEEGINLGVDVVEKILLQFPDTDPYWLITGERLSRNTDKKGTAATNSDEAALLREEMGVLREQLAFLSAQNSDLSANNRKLTELLFSRKVVEQR